MRRWPLRLAALLAMWPTYAMAQLEVRRGANLEIWQTWPSVADILADPTRVDVFPEWRRSAAAAELRTLVTQGFDFIRIPFDPAPLLALQGKARANLIAQIRATAEMGHAAGLSVIVDLHSFPRPSEGWGTDSILHDPALWDRYLDIMGEVGRAIADLPADRTAYEPINEPTLDCEDIASGGTQRWPAMLAELHSAARTAAPDLALVVTGACWGGAWGLTALPDRHPVFLDANTIFSIHNYDPFLFSHQGATWTNGPEAAFAGLPFPPTGLTAQAIADLAQRAAQSDAPSRPTQAEARALIAQYAASAQALIAAEIARAADWADAKGISRNRLILGEFGALIADAADPSQTSSRSAFLDRKRTAAEDAGVAWAVWNIGGSGGFGLAAPDMQLAPADCAALGLTCAAN